MAARGTAQQYVYVELPEAEARALWEAAWAARQAGRSVFTCSAAAGESKASSVGALTLRQWSLGYLIEAIESQGWRLENLDHVWIQTTNETGRAGDANRGAVTAQMLFRRTEPRST